MPSEKQNPVVVALIVLLSMAVALLVSQHWGMMLSNSDDPWLTRASWDDVKAFASSQKRFWMLAINGITRWPYQLGGWELTNATKMLINSATLLAFALFLQRLVSLPYALLCTLTWLCFMDVSNGYYSPFHGYVLMFNLPMGLLFMSLWWYVRQIDAGQTGWGLLGPYALFGLALLGYEPMMFFAASFPAIALYRRSLGHAVVPLHLKPLPAAQAWLQQNWLLGAVVLVFCGCYFGFRMLHSGSDSGSLVNPGDDVSAIVKTVFRFSVYGMRAELGPVNLTDRGLGWLPLAYGALLLTVAYLLLPRLDQAAGERVLRSPWAIAALCYFTFSLNLLHSLTEGYRQWAADSPYYVGNYLSSFALSMLLAGGWTALVGGKKAQHERVLALVLLYVAANSAISNMHKWSTLAQVNRQDAQLWHIAIDDLKKRQPLDVSLSSWKVCARSAPEKVSGDDRFWSYVLSQELGQTVVFQSKQRQSSGCDITVDFMTYRQRATSRLN